MTRAVGYARRSNDKQDGFDIPAQKRSIQTYCQAHGYELVRIYVDDGISGAEWAKHKEFQELLADAANGQFKTLVFQEQARLTRDPDIDRIMNMLIGAGIAIEATQDVMDWKTDGGRATVRMKATMNTFYREYNAESIRDRKLEMAKLGYQQGDPPYGYVRGADKVFVVVSTEAEIPTEMFTRCWGGDSSTAIAKDLNARGLRTRQGRLWNRDSVYGILTNPTYAGLVHHNYRTTKNIIGPDKHVAIVSEDRFWAVQNLLASRRKGGSSQPFGRDPLPLTGVAFDRRGHRLAGAGRGLMRCYENRMLDGSACDQGTAHVETLEAQAMIAPPDGDPAAIRRDQAKLLDAYRADCIDFPTFKAEMDPLKAQLTALEAPQRNFDVDAALALVRDQGAQWDAMDRAERRTYIHIVFDRCVVEGEQIVSIQPKMEWEALFIADREERFADVRSLVGPAGFEPATERL